MANVLIIGEDPANIDFDAPDAPPDMSEQKVRDGLNGSRDRLRGMGHEAEILLTEGEYRVVDQVETALGVRAYDVIVIGAGLRTLPKMARQFEIMINALHRSAPGALLAFNSQPDDSDKAALRVLG